ncbi:MAG: adenylate/guanylate cyclase domain-containing protein, partial [Acidimicrobiia bacterium]
MTSRSSLERFVPRVASEWDLEAQGALHRVIDGTLCFVDISGFTNLSEKLARRGRIGAEELTDVLDRVFGEMLRLAYDRGGSLLKFGGDALLLMFEGPDHPLQGASAAVEMRAALREATKIPTSVGRIALRMSVGLHTGEIDFYRVGGSHHELVITGAVATTTTEMEAAADANEILISPALAAALPAAAASEDKGPGVLLRWRKAPVDPVGPQYRIDVGTDVIERCVPTVLRANLMHGIAEPEHRVATVAFVKFKGIADAMTAGGPARVAAGLDELVRAIQDACDAEGVTFLATDIDADGGKIILTTGAPVTQEDDEGRILRTVRRVADAGTSLPLRIGVNRGHVFAGEIGTAFRSTYTVMGDTVNLAARLMAAAPAGGVYVSPTVLDRSRTLFEATPLEPFRVKGKAEPVQAYALGAERGTRTTEPGGGLPFRGRDAETERIRAAITGLDTGSTTLTVVGETGMGKSRLIEEATQDSDTPVFRIQGEATGADNPYWATRDPLRNLLGIERRSQAEMAARLRDEVTRRAPDLLPLLPLLGDVTHIDIEETPETAAIDPRFRPDRTATALAVLLRSVFPGPLVIVVEDRHWLDDATLGLLERLPTELAGLLVLSTTRPPAPPDVEVITLESLDVEAARAIAIAATDATPLRPHELEAVVTRAGGNPLFLEEILRLIKETGSTETLPESLDAVVGAEIDTLPPLARRLLRYSSVLGRTFRRVVLDELIAPEDVVLDDATREALARFLDPEGTERLRFRHAVMLDAAYEGLSYHKRRELHAWAGQVIERLAGQDTHAVAEFLALHYARAGEHGAAWKYGVIAGDKARHAYANVEAAGHYRRALEATRRAGVATHQERARVWG